MQSQTRRIRLAQATTAAGSVFLAFILVVTAFPSNELPDATAVDDAAGSSAVLGFPVIHTAGGAPVAEERYAGELPVFAQRYVGGGADLPMTDRDPSAWESTIGIGPDGSAYYLAASRDLDPQTGVAEYDQISISKVRPPEVWRSDDQGLTWNDVSPWLIADDILRGAAPALVESPGSSGDPFLHVDAETGRVFSYQQQAYFLCDHWAISETKGASWDEWNTCDDEHSWGDHPSIATGTPRAHETDGYQNAVYFCSTAGCRASFDGGYTWTGNAPTSSECDESNGHLKVGPDGTLYLPRKNCGGAQLAISRDDAQTWTEVLVDDTVWQEGVEEAALHDHEAHIAIDADNNLYYFWIGDDHLPYLATSTDGGATWSAPIAVGAPGVTHAIYPHIVAGPTGNVAFFYFATTVESGDRTDPDAVWNGYVGFSIDALDADPVFATTLAHDPDDPLHRGPCILWRCYVGEGPAGMIPEDLKKFPYDGYPPGGVGMEGVFDFLDMEIDPVTGAVWVALIDLCNDDCVDGDGAARAKAAVGVQIGGTFLR